MLTRSVRGPRTVIDRARRARWFEPSALILGAGVAAILTGAAWAGETYKLGHGYDIGPINLAGYANVTLSMPNEGQKALTLEDLSLFATGHISKLINPFIEAELTHVVIAHSSPSDDREPDAAFTFERYYNDAYITPEVTLRLGKMLAPVGEWNLIHAAPLVLTTTRPAVTYRNFSAYITGVSMLYSDPESQRPDVQIYWQPDREESEKPRAITFENHRRAEGIHLSLPLSLLDKVGASYQHSVDPDDVTQSLFGVDYHLTLGKTALQGEATYSTLSGGTVPRARNTEWGGYLAASYTFDHHWSASTWYEAFLKRDENTPAQDLLFGLAYHPQSAMVIKLEYVQNIGGAPVNPTGIFASWSILF